MGDGQRDVFISYRYADADGIRTLARNLMSVKYLNNRLGSDHGKLKRPDQAHPRLSVSEDSIRDAQGLEVMRMFKKGQFKHGSRP